MCNDFIVQLTMDVYGDVGPVYHAGFRVQRGSGIGSFLGGLFRIVKPLIMRGAKTVGKEVLKTGASILSDIATKNKDDKIENIVNKRVTETVNKNMTGSGIKRSVKRKRIQSSTRSRARKNKRTKTDIFDQS